MPPIESSAMILALWAGIALVALPALQGWQHATLVSPVFVYVLLTRISGIPMLESRAKKRWGDDAAFRAYKARTPALWLRPPRPSPDSEGRAGRLV